MLRAALRMLLLFIHAVAETSCKESGRIAKVEDCDGSDSNHVTGCDVIKMADGMLQGRVLRWSSDVGSMQ